MGCHRYLESSEIGLLHKYAAPQQISLNLSGLQQTYPFATERWCECHTVLIILILETLSHIRKQFNDMNQISFVKYMVFRLNQYFIERELSVKLDFVFHDVKYFKQKHLNYSILSCDARFLLTGASHFFNCVHMPVTLCYF